MEENKILAANNLRVIIKMYVYVCVYVYVYQVYINVYVCSYITYICNCAMAYISNIIFHGIFVTYFKMYCAYIVADFEARK